MNKFEPSPFVLGGEIGWDGTTREVKILYGDNEVSIGIDSGTATVDSKKQEMENKPNIIDGRTYLPLRFVI